MASMSPSPHFLLFPFMSKGHTIPLLHLAHLLLRRNITVSVISTPSNAAFIRDSLSDTNASVVVLPFPQDIPEIPHGTESTDKLPSMSLFLPLATATKLMQPDFDQTLQSLPRVNCIVSDAFLYWAQESASRSNTPILFFYGMNNYVMTIFRLLGQYRPQANVNSANEAFTLPIFDRIKLTKHDIDTPFHDPDPSHPYVTFVMEQVVAASKTMGYVMNSFYELEPEFVDYWNRECEPKAWCVGPLCLAQPQKAQPMKKPKWIQWLDEKASSGRSVLYAAFGSQAEISSEQYQEIATGLERSEVSFLWVTRTKNHLEIDGFEERIKDRGLVVRDWVDQVEILSHTSVNGFMSHCGWNSVMESICSSVPILAWPMMAEQHLNARMVVEELGVGIRVLARNGSVRGFVDSKCIEATVKDLMEGKKGKAVRMKAKEVGELANKAMVEGGSSWRTLDLLIEEKEHLLPSSPSLNIFPTKLFSLRVPDSHGTTQVRNFDLNEVPKEIQCSQASVVVEPTQVKTNNSVQTSQDTVSKVRGRKSRARKLDFTSSKP